MSYIRNKKKQSGKSTKKTVVVVKKVVQVEEVNEVIPTSPLFPSQIVTEHIQKDLTKEQLEGIRNSFKKVNPNTKDILPRFHIPEEYSHTPTMDEYKEYVNIYMDNQGYIEYIGNHVGVNNSTFDKLVMNEEWFAPIVEPDCGNRLNMYRKTLARYSKFSSPYSSEYCAMLLVSSPYKKDASIMKLAYHDLRTKYKEELEVIEGKESE